jgi:hypothetical protein
VPEPNTVFKAYLDVERLLSGMGTSLDEFPDFPVLDTSDLDNNDAIDCAAEKKLFDKLYAQIKENPEQRAVLDELIRVCNNREILAVSASLHPF